MIKMTPSGDYFSEDSEFGVLVYEDENFPYQLASLDMNYAYQRFEDSSIPGNVVSHNISALESLMQFLNQVIFAEKQRLGLKQKEEPKITDYDIKQQIQDLAEVGKDSDAKFMLMVNRNLLIHQAEVKRV